MKNRTYILWLVLFILLSKFGAAQREVYNSGLILFTDRYHCMSGDTIWVKAKLPEKYNAEGNVVRLQLENKTGDFIRLTAITSKAGWAEGFVSIPDSLSTGQYFITGWMYAGDSVSRVLPETKSLLVYNRFDENVAEIDLVNNGAQLVETENRLAEILTDRVQYKTRDKVKVDFKFKSENQIADCVVKATLLDPLASETANYKLSYQPVEIPAKDFTEKSGYLLSGQVTDNDGITQSNVLVVLNLSSQSSYFDYCVTGADGSFHFFLKEAVGSAEVILQVFSPTNKNYHVALSNQSLPRSKPILQQTKILTQDQASFIKDAILASFARRLFNPSLPNAGDTLKMPASIPFYGSYSQRVFPAEFFDFPDFREISRELLPGFQYRVKNGQISFRMINRVQGTLFDDNPLRLINGIPVFDNNMFANLKSTDIDYIDLVYSERIYGDLIMKGIINVSLINKSNSWLSDKPNLFRFQVDFLQPEKSPYYLVSKTLKQNEPDMRQVFIWEKVNENSAEFEFQLSDMKGIVELSVEGFTNDNHYFRVTKTIEVK